MNQISDFIVKARARNLPEETIRGALAKAGWTSDDIDEALLVGLEVPTPPNTPDKSNSSGDRPTLGSLESALLHVLLWFFTAASTVAIGAVSSSLFGGSVSPEALASMIAVAVITFTPYAIFFVKYLRQVRKSADLIPGRVWSIITICIHSIGAMVAGITLVVGLIIGSQPSVTLGASLIAILNIVILFSYAQASFAQPSKLRRSSLHLHLLVLAVLLGGLFTISIIRLAPAQADNATRERLVESTQQIADFTSRHGQLPSADELSLPSGITYQPTSGSVYELCADFQIDTTSTNNPGYRQAINDSYVGVYDFSHHSKGSHCFEMHSEIISTEPSDSGLNPSLTDLE